MPLQNFAVVSQRHLPVVHHISFENVLFFLVGHWNHLFDAVLEQVFLGVDSRVSHRTGPNHWEFGLGFYFFALSFPIPFILFVSFHLSLFFGGSIFLWMRQLRHDGRPVYGACHVKLCIVKCIFLSRFLFRVGCHLAQRSFDGRLAVFISELFGTNNVKAPASDPLSQSWHL